MHGLIEQCSINRVKNGIDSKQYLTALTSLGKDIIKKIDYITKYVYIFHIKLTFKNCIVMEHPYFRLTSFFVCIELLRLADLVTFEKPFTVIFRSLGLLAVGKDSSPPKGVTDTKSVVFLPSASF